jgi:hypothetical protein
MREDVVEEEKDKKWGRGREDKGAGGLGIGWERKRDGGEGRALFACL